jgi:hypothetical protein
MRLFCLGFLGTVSLALIGCGDAAEPKKTPEELNKMQNLDQKNADDAERSRAAENKKKN